MNKNKRILLYGNSVILGSIGAGLRRCSQFEVTTLAPPQQEMQTVAAAQTDILLFDLETTPPEALFPLLETHQTSQLIGISPDINLVKVWSIRELREVSMRDLLRVIENETTDLSTGSGGAYQDVMNGITQCKVMP